jgi:hypothetical protein
LADLQERAAKTQTASTPSKTVNGRPKRHHARAWARARIAYELITRVEARVPSATGSRVG